MSMKKSDQEQLHNRVVSEYREEVLRAYDKHQLESLPEGNPFKALAEFHSWGMHSDPRYHTARCPICQRASQKEEIQ